MTPNSGTGKLYEMKVVTVKKENKPESFFDRGTPEPIDNLRVPQGVPVLESES